ncbi:Oxidase ustYa [Lachnellula suecica]|uniref:Oxidase ustYa n=1 Tax=Lachnellula suecica TaxID=602035 RepID=A0A8T9CD66_9HELO|nr:Oxidase ustYa [Lachnellula suecica]
MPYSFFSQPIRDTEEKDPIFECLEVEEQDGEVDDHQWPQYEHSQRRSTLWNVVYFALGIILGVVGLLAIPLVETTFERHELFAEPSSKESDEAWHSLLPIGDGFIIVNDSQALGLPPGSPRPNGEAYDISVFHQLHCLTRIREILSVTRHAVNHTNSKHIMEIMVEPSMTHIYHCFDYIRQALMCAGDLTLEWPRTEKDGRRFAVDGWGVSHQCKSWEAISDYMTSDKEQT